MIYVSKVSKLIIMCILTDTDTKKGTGKAQEHKLAGQHKCQAPNNEQQLGGEHKITPNNSQPAPSPPPFRLHSPRTHHKPPTPEQQRTRWTIKGKANNKQQGQWQMWVGMRLGEHKYHHHTPTPVAAAAVWQLQQQWHPPPFVFVLFYLVFHLASMISSVSSSYVF